MPNHDSEANGGWDQILLLRQRWQTEIIIEVLEFDWYVVDQHELPTQNSKHQKPEISHRSNSIVPVAQPNVVISLSFLFHLIFTSFNRLSLRQIHLIYLLFFVDILLPFKSQLDWVQCLLENTCVLKRASAIQDIEELHHEEALVNERIVFAFLWWHQLILLLLMHIVSYTSLLLDRCLHRHMCQHPHVYPPLILMCHPNWAIVEYEEEHHLLVYCADEIMNSYFSGDQSIFFMIESFGLSHYIVLLSFSSVLLFFSFSLLVRSSICLFSQVSGEVKHW